MDDTSVVFVDSILRTSGLVASCQQGSFSSRQWSEGEICHDVRQTTTTPLSHAGADLAVVVASSSGHAPDREEARRRELDADGCPRDKQEIDLSLEPD